MHKNTILEFRILTKNKNLSVTENDTLHKTIFRLIPYQGNVRTNAEMYRFYLPDKMPKTQKEMEIFPDFPFKKEFYEQKIKDLKHYAIKFLSKKSDGNKHQNYYELLLLYGALNSDIKVEPVKNDDKFSLKTE